MTVREANFVDIPSMARLYHDEGYLRSRYVGKATFDMVEAKQLFARSLQRHGHMNYGGTLALVSETDGEIRGFMIGFLDNPYPCLKELMVTDLLFLLAPGAHARDASEMLRRLIAWGESNPKVIEVCLLANDVIGDHERTAKLYERQGLARCGAMFRRGFER